MQRLITKAEQAAFIERLSAGDRKQIATLQQGTEEWLDSRKGRLTGSIIGAVCGHNFFCRHDQLLRELLWNTFQGNDATRYGNQYEATAAEIYGNYSLGTTVEFTGLQVHPVFGWLGYSPDGLIGTDGLLEIKCPFKKKFYPTIPMYYYDQIQYGLWLLQRAYCDFVVYTTHETSIERFPYDKDYVESFLVPRVQNFYFHKYLPLLLAKERGWLNEGEISLPSDVRVEYFRPF